MGKKTVIYVILLLLILIASVAFALDLIPFTKQKVGEKVKSLYELANPGIAVEIIQISKESGIYKVLMKTTDITGAVGLMEAYVTKDGKLLISTESVIRVEKFIEQMTKMRNFVDCLDSKGVRIAGISNQTATLLQLNVLGTYSTKLYFACEGNQLNACVQAGITQVPSVIFNNTAYPGVQTVQWFESLTGCKLG